MTASVSLIFVTQLIDPDDPVLGFVVGWVRALRERCERLTVIANEVRHSPIDLAGTVYSLGKENGASRIYRSLRYLRLLEHLTRRNSHDALVAHMCPEYATLAAPATRLRRIPTFLWYAHPSYTSRLRAAEKVCDGILTSLPGSYPGRHGRVRVIGQGIDMTSFRPSPPVQPLRPLRLLALGRTSPMKGFAVALRALALGSNMGVDARLRIVGPSTTGPERAHRAELGQLADELGLAQMVTIEEAVPPDQVHEEIRTSHLLLNAMAKGSGDKVVFEAMATGRPVLVSNPSFATLLDGLKPDASFRDGDTAGLANAIKRYAELDGHELERIGADVRRRVEEEHSVAHWADAVLSEILDHRHSRCS